MASSKAKWESFFLQAGVPQRLADEYAATFSCNRMRLDMLNELNKELLRDLGVKALGDIIGILRHAKEKQSSLKKSPSPQPAPVSAPQPRTQPRTLPRTQPRTQPRLQPRPRVPLEKVKSKAPPPDAPSPSQLKIITTQKVNQIKTKSVGAINIKERPIKANNANTSTVLNASSALISSKPSRQKLSERFDEFETEAKRKKMVDDGKLKVQTMSEIKNIRIGDRTKVRQVPEIQQTIIAPSLPANKAEGKYIGIKVGDKIKLKAVPQVQNREEGPKGPQATPAKPTQFTVQVPSKQPCNIQETSKNKQKVTVVPAQGKALNRTKPLTSIFDRLDAPSSSSNALSLLSKDELTNLKDNVFKRLGTKSDDNPENAQKSQVAVGVVQPASSSARLGEKHGSESVFNRLGDHHI